MKILNDLSAGFKVIMLAVILLAFLVVMAVMGIYGGKSIKSELDHMYSDNLVALSAAKEAKVQLVTTSRVLLNMAVTSDANLIKVFDGQYATAIDKTFFSVREAKSKMASQSNKDLADQVLAGLTEMKNKQSEALAILRSPDSTPEQRGAAPGLSKDAAIKTDGIMSKLCETLETEAAEKLQAAEAIYERSFLMSCAFFVAALVLGVALSLLIRASIAPPLAAVSRKAEQVARGNLDQHFTLDRKDEIGSLAASLETMVNTLRSRIAEAEQKSVESAQQSEKAQTATAEAREAGEKAEAGRQAILQAAVRVEQVVERLFAATGSLSTQIAEASNVASTQSEQVTSSVTAMDEMNASVTEVARGASTAADGSENARSKAREGERVVNSSLEAITNVRTATYTLRDQMEELGGKATAIGAILTVISDIADQTNLLALNAAIEAARAGEAGRGFAVVADEVRKLAEKTMVATREVEDAITGIQHDTNSSIKAVEENVRRLEQTTELVGQSGETLAQIVAYSETSADQVRDIATASEQQAQVSEEVARALGDIDRMAEETAGVMARSSDAVEELSRQASQLHDLVAELRQL